MKLRRIQLVGFKSFKDKVSIELSDDMNGIVGPNGCGKSNVVDALKWAMGDMSAKSLRGSALSDVIFGGSQNHRAAGMAEVTLTFENTDTPADLGAPRDQSGAGFAGDDGVGGDDGLGGEKDGVGGENTENPDAGGIETSADPKPDQAEGEQNKDRHAIDNQDIAQKNSQNSEKTPGEERLTWVDAIPREYREMAEISITRRLYRSGESEYLINKTPCRLMDIQNLLAGTGLGKQGYSVIEQGEVAFVVSAKPSERRLIIEEASGITRYKAQRDRSQRKLDRARENLQRVDDVVQEVEKQLRNLERQARRAERYKQMSEELRLLEIAALVDRRQALSKKASSLRESLQSGRSDSEKAQLKLKEAEGQLTNRKVDAFVADQKSAEATEYFYKLDTRLNLAKSNRKHLESSLQEAKNRHARALSEHAEQLGRRAGLEKELARVSAEYKQMAERPEDAQGRIEQMEADVVTAREKLQEAEALRADKKSRLEQLRQEIRRLGDRRAWLAGQIDEISQRREQVATEIAAAEQDGEDLRRALNRLKMNLENAEEALTAEKNAQKDAQDALLRAKRTLNDAQKELDELRAERVELAARHKSLSDMRRRGEGYTRGVQRVLEWARDKRSEDDPDQENDSHSPVNLSEIREAILAPVGDLLEVPEGMEAAVSAYIGDIFNDIVVKNRTAALEAIAMLSRQKEGRAGFYVLQNSQDPEESQESQNSQEKKAAELKALLEGLELVDELPAAKPPNDFPSDTSQAASSNTRAWATRQGDIEFSNGRIIGGHLGNQAESVLRQARELKALGEELARAEAWELDAQEEFDAAQDKLKLVEERVLISRQAVEKWEFERRRLEQELIGEERELERADRRKNRVKAEVAPLEERLQRVMQDAAQSDGDASAFTEQIPGLQTEIARDDAHCDALRTELESLQQAVTDQKIELAKDHERRRSLAESVERLKRALHNNQAQIDKLERDAREQQSRLEEFEQNSTDTLTEVGDLEDEFKQAKSLADTAREHLEQVQNQVRQLELQILERRRAVEQTVGTLGQLEMSLREVSIEIEHADRDLVERFELGFFEASNLAAAQARENSGLAELTVEARQQRIKTLRRDIDKLGPVNAMAVHEFEEARERREFLETQQLDLHASIDDLTRAIRRMDRESRARFQQTFEAVNARFQQFFPRLFRGGHARLMLTDPDNILESGVDIEVSPPGKRLQNVTLLSGGEKALTAVSLIFAIFSLKPTPFSVLDEVDAPLDEANVGRFAEMVRELSKQSQMIVITHNRRSMEVCDTLYGVTMQEPGVSKVVSVRLQDLDPVDGRRAS